MLLLSEPPGNSPGFANSVLYLNCLFWIEHVPSLLIRGLKVALPHILVYWTLVLQALKSEDIYWLEEGQESDLMVLCAIE